MKISYNVGDIIFVKLGKDDWVSRALYYPARITDKQEIPTTRWVGNVQKNTTHVTIKAVWMTEAVHGCEPHPSQAGQVVYLKGPGYWFQPSSRYCLTEARFLNIKDEYFAKTQVQREAKQEVAVLTEAYYDALWLWLRKAPAAERKAWFKKYVKVWFSERYPQEARAAVQKLRDEAAAFGKKGV